jgi:hypothetical protein
MAAAGADLIVDKHGSSLNTILAVFSYFYSLNAVFPQLTQPSYNRHFAVIPKP